MSELPSSLDNTDAWALSPESLIQVVYSTGIGSVDEESHLSYQ